MSLYESIAKLFVKQTPREPRIKLAEFERTIDKLAASLIARESQMQSNNKRMAAILSALPDLVFQIDYKGDVVCWHGPEDELYIPSSEMEGANINFYLPAELAVETMDRISKTLETGEPQVYEYGLVIRGVHQIYECRMVKLTDISVLTVIRNITKLREAELKITWKSNMIRHMANNLPEMFWSKDIEGKFVFLNKLYSERLLHRSEKVDAVGAKIRDLLPGTFAVDDENGDRRVILLKKSIRFIVRYQVPNEPELWLDVYKGPWWSVEFPKRVIGIVGSARDITNCMPTVSKHQFMEEGLRIKEVSFDQCFHWKNSDPPCTECG